MMEKLANISSFERLQGQANKGFVADLAVFNGKYTDEALIEMRRIDPKWQTNVNLWDVAYSLLNVMLKRSNLDDLSYRKLHHLVKEETWDIAERIAEFNGLTAKETASMADTLSSRVLNAIAVSGEYNDNPRKKSNDYSSLQLNPAKVNAPSPSISVDGRVGGF